MFGNHCVKTYNQSQDTVALSSGGSEFYGIVKAATMGHCLRGLLEDLGAEVGVLVDTGSNVAKSIASRRGVGRVRRLEVQELWVQDSVAKGELTVVKVRGEINVADGLIKHVERRKMDAHMIWRAD